MEKLMNVFVKKEATVNELNELTALLKEHKFFVADNAKHNVATDTYKVAHVGVTKDRATNNVGSLISIWNTNKATDRAFNVRISNDLHNTLSAKSDALKVLLDTATYKDSDELCIKFYSIADVKMFFEKLFAYTATATATKEATEQKEVLAV